MRTTSFPLGRVGGGELAIIGRPRGGDWLDDELRDLRAAGVHVLVSMLCPDEARELELEREAESAAACGLEFVSFPVIDRGLPDVVVARPILALLSAALAAGQSVAVHCRMGIGRSGLVAAALLKRSGLSSDEAWARVQEARGRPVPDTPEQRDWVSAL